MAEYNLYEKKLGNGKIAVYIKKSYRDSEGKSRTLSLGKVGNKEVFKNSEELEAKAQEIYQKWLEESANKATVIFNKEQDVDEDSDVKLGSYYIGHFLSTLGLNDYVSKIREKNGGKFKYNLSDIVEMLVTSQILGPSSKRSVSRSRLKKQHWNEIELQHIYRALEIIAGESDSICAYSYKAVTSALEKKSKLFFYDCTNFFYTQGSEGELLGMKKSKEGIFAPLVQMGLLIDEWGFLAGMIVFRGNRNEQSTLKEQIEKISLEISMDDVVVCTDAGLCSFDNKILLSQHGRSYITVQPITGRCVPQFVSDWAVSDDGFTDVEGKPFTPSGIKKAAEKAEEKEYEALKEKTVYKEGWFIATVTKQKAIRIEGRKNRKWVEEEVDVMAEDFSIVNPDVRYSVSYTDKASGPDAEHAKNQIITRLVVSFSYKYYLKKCHKIEDSVRKIESMPKTDKMKKKLPPSLENSSRKYLDIAMCTESGEIAENMLVEVDYTKVEDDKKYAGFYVQATNRNDSITYLCEEGHMRWQVEYCFRTMKSHLDARPVYLTTREHIIGHFTIVFLALQIFKYMMYKLYLEKGHKDEKLGTAKEESDITVDRIMEELRIMTGRRHHAEEGYDFIEGAGKNEINMMMAKAFGISLTKKVLSINRLEAYRKGKDY